MGRKSILTLAALLAMSVMTAFTAFAASEFEGVWTVEGRKGAKFDVTLSADGKASTTHPKAMTGTWTEDGWHRHHQMGYRLDHEDQQRGRSLREAVRHGGRQDRQPVSGRQKVIASG